jgi:xanthine dehydrogenase accessory factor
MKFVAGLSRKYWRTGKSWDKEEHMLHGEIWKYIYDKLLGGLDICLMVVVDSKGSSPGRKGFKLAVCSDGCFYGTIGGGIMEHKLVEKAKSLLNSSGWTPFIMHQFHDKEHTQDRSGMICSGQQTIAYIPICKAEKDIIQAIAEKKESCYRISPAGIQLEKEAHGIFHEISASDWYFNEAINQQTTVHIVGAGHVGLALSEILHFLGMNVIIYDNRPELNTLEKNQFVSEKKIICYEAIYENLSPKSSDYLVIMTIGYRTDKTVLKQLIRHEFAYIGMLGSQKKIENLFQEMKAEGIEESLLHKVHSPIGLPISAKTAQEIAISIAAEVIQIKNKNT